MVGLASRWLVGDRLRAWSVLLSVLLAVSSFTVLTGSINTSTLAVTQTLDANYRGTYDILVRPNGTQSSLEQSQQLVRPNFLSGLYGGITNDQVTAVREVDGVEVAAPIAMVGTVFESVTVPVDVTSHVGSTGRSMVLFRTTFTSQGGRTSVPGPSGYVYVTDGQLTTTQGANIAMRDSKQTGHPCVNPTAETQGKSPFDPDTSWIPVCWPRTPDPVSGRTTPLGQGRFPAMVRVAVPVTLAAIDPEAEDKLVGLSRATTDGTYLAPQMGASKISLPVGGGDNQDFPTVPILASTRPVFQEQVTVKVRPVPADKVASVLAKTTAPQQRQATQALWSDPAVAGTVQAQDMVDEWMRSFQVMEGATPRVPTAPMGGFWSGGPVTYRPGSSPLAPQEAPVPESVWLPRTRLGIHDTVPAEAALPGFRTLTGHPTNLDGRHITPPRFQLVGSFDPTKIATFSPLSKVPMETYQSPESQVRGTKDVLAPNFEPAGYLQAPPMMLTTLAALPAFANEDAFTNPMNLDAPISSVRVRVAGVTGTDAVSREKVRLVAEQIATRTGLAVDITMGSSPAPVQVDVPVGAAGKRTTLGLTEGWSKKGVVSSIQTAADKKSVLLFFLVLLASALGVAMSAGSSVDARRSEIATLRSVGWSRSDVSRRILLELTLAGAIAGLAGALVAIPVSLALGVGISWPRLALAVPAAIALCAAAAAIPARRAARVTPIEGLRPRVTTPRRGQRNPGLIGLALSALRRNRGRVALSVAAIAVGAAALQVVLGVVLAFRGNVVGTLLGDAVAMQVRTQDIAAVAIIWLLSLLSVVNYAMLEVKEHSEFFALLKAFGWSTPRSAVIVTLQGLALGALGGLIGVGTGLALTATFVHLTTSIYLIALAILGLIVLTTALVATAPTLALRRLSVARILSQEEE